MNEKLFFVALLPAIGYVAIWLWVGGLYYLKYPGAELIDDAIILGRSSEFTYNHLASIQNRDVRSECEKLRKELSIRKTTVWEKLLFSINGQKLPHKFR